MQFFRVFASKVTSTPNNDKERKAMSECQSARVTYSYAISSMTNFFKDRVYSYVLSFATKNVMISVINKYKYWSPSTPSTIVDR
jgi:hypothetical protein